LLRHWYICISYSFSADLFRIERTFLIIEPTRCTNFSKCYFGMKVYMFRTVPLSIIRRFSLYTQQWYMSYRFCWQLASRMRMDPDPARKLSAKPVWHIPLLCLEWKTAGDGQRNCPKHVEFHSKIKYWEISASSWFYYKRFLSSSGVFHCTHSNGICHTGFADSLRAGSGSILILLASCQQNLYDIHHCCV